jgi:hypothetical protein
MFEQFDNHAHLEKINVMFVPTFEILQDRLLIDLFQPRSLPFSLIFRFRSIRDEGYHIEDLSERVPMQKIAIRHAETQTEPVKRG